jgi:hypothetical protein
VRKVTTGGVRAYRVAAGVTVIIVAVPVPTGAPTAGSETGGGSGIGFPGVGNVTTGI